MMLLHTLNGQPVSNDYTILTNYTACLLYTSNNANDYFVLRSSAIELTDDAIREIVAEQLDFAVDVYKRQAQDFPLFLLQLHSDCGYC